MLDADDRLAPGALAALRPALEADPELGFAYGTVHFFGAWEGEMTMPAHDPYMLLYRHTIGSTALMRRALWEDVGGYDPEFRGFEDGSSAARLRRGAGAESSRRCSTAGTATR